jgi:shikimate dehydrogenase
VPVQVGAPQLAAFAQAVLAAGNVDGLWLTIPHKTTLLPLLQHVDAAGRIAQSVNAVRRHADGRLQGGLFDGSGLLGALRHFGIPLAGQRVLLLGTGGAGAAIAAALLGEPLAALALHDLGQRAIQLAQRLADPRVCVSGPDPAGFDLVINATPLGLRAGDPLPFDVARLTPGAQVVDILMKPQPTPLLQACAARGIRAHPGFEMLVQQVPDYLRFFGLQALADTLQHNLDDVRQHLPLA